MKIEITKAPNLLTNGFLQTYNSDGSVKVSVYTILDTLGALANSAGYLYNSGAGSLSYHVPTATTVGLGNVTNDTQIKSSDFPSSSVDSEVVLFSGTSGKVVKRASASGIAVVTSGVLSTITDSHTNWDTAYSHVSLTNNPHSVTATQVGLGNVTNESKAAMFTSPTFTGTTTCNGAIIAGAALDQTSYLQLSYCSDASSRSWRLRADVTTFGDFCIQQSTTQTGSTYSTKLRFDSAGAATFTSGVTAAGFTSSTSVALTGTTNNVGTITTGTWNAGAITVTSGNILLADLTNPQLEFYSTAYRIQMVGSSGVMSFITNNVIGLSIDNSGAGVTVSGWLNSGAITATNAAGVVATFKGYSRTGGASAYNGSLQLGSNAAYAGFIDYDAITGYTTLNIDNSFDNAAASIKLRLRTAGTPINALTLLGSGAATFASTLGSGVHTVTTATDAAGLTITNSTQSPAIKLLSGLDHVDARNYAITTNYNALGDWILFQGTSKGSEPLSATAVLQFVKTGAATFSSTINSGAITVISAGVASTFTSGAGGYSGISWTSSGESVYGSAAVYSGKVYIGSRNGGGTGSNGEILINPNIGPVLTLNADYSSTFVSTVGATGLDVNGARGVNSITIVASTSTLASGLVFNNGGGNATIGLDNSTGTVFNHGNYVFNINSPTPMVLSTGTSSVLTLGMDLSATFASGVTAAAIRSTATIERAGAILDNAYYDGAWKRRITGYASYFGQALSYDTISIGVADTGAANSTITWVWPLTITSPSGLSSFSAPVTVTSSTAGEVDYVVASNTNASGFAGIRIDRKNDIRYALLKYSTDGVVDWYAGTAYHAGAANSDYTIGTGISGTDAKLTITTAGVATFASNVNVSGDITQTTTGGLCVHDLVSTGVVGSTDVRFRQGITGISNGGCSIRDLTNTRDWFQGNSDGSITIPGAATFASGLTVGGNIGRGSGAMAISTAAFDGTSPLLVLYQSASNLGVLFNYGYGGSGEKFILNTYNGSSWADRFVVDRTGAGVFAASVSVEAGSGAAYSGMISEYLDGGTTSSVFRIDGKGGTSWTGAIDLRTSTNAGSLTSRMYIRDTGIGIGTTAPNEALEVKGNIQLTIGTSDKHIRVGSSSNWWYDLSAVGDDFGIYSGNVATPYMYFDYSTSGRVGIGTATPGYQLEVVGTCGVTGVFTANAGTGNSFTLPASRGTNTYFLQTDGAGATSWVSVAASQVYKGTWLASTNTPTLADGSGTAGWYYRAVDAGTVNFGAGNITFAAGDDVSYNGSIWQKIPAASYTLQIASPTVLGGVRIPSSADFSINGSGDLSLAVGAKTTLGINNVTNESKATMFASPTFTGTVTTPSGIAFTAPVLGTPASGTLTNCTIPASALTGTTLAASVVSSSLTSVGTLATLTVTATIVGSITGNAGGSSASCTGLAATATALATPRAIYGNNFDGTAALTQIIASTYGGTGNGFTKFTGPTTAEKTFTLPDASSTLLYSGGALGTPSSGTVTNLTGTASININGTVGATTPAAGYFTTLNTTTTATLADINTSTITCTSITPQFDNTSDLGTLTGPKRFRSLRLGTDASIGGVIELGHATDTTIARVSAGVISVEGSNVLLASGIGSIVQAYNSYLTAINQALTTSSSPSFTAVSATTFTGALTGTASGNLVAADIGVSIQAYNSNLTAINQALTTSSSPSFTAVSATTFTGALTGTASGNLVAGGALGTPSSGTVTNLTGTANININGTVGATTPAAGTFTALTATSGLQVSGGSTILYATRPSADNSFDLGTIGYQWKDIYAAGIIYSGGFSTASASTLGATRIMAFTSTPGSLVNEQVWVEKTGTTYELKVRSSGATYTIASVTV